MDRERVRDAICLGAVSKLLALARLLALSRVFAPVGPKNGEVGSDIAMSFPFVHRSDIAMLWKLSNLYGLLS